MKPSMKIDFVIDKKYHWANEEVNNLVVHYNGHRASVMAIAKMLDTSYLPDLSSLGSKLADLPGHFAACFVGAKWSLIVADKISSYPIFYILRDKSLIVSNSARTLANKYELHKVDKESLTEFRMTGYVTGKDTLFKDLSKLRAGEALLFGQNTLEFKRYYQFHSALTDTKKEIDLINELEDITNTVFDRLIESMHGRRIVIPLSGGLDSRLVLCKLLERGAKNIFTFSYGSPGNRDALAAKDIASKLGLSWEFIPTGRKQAKDIFSSSLRKEYWNYSDHLHIVPSMHTFCALSSLHHQKRLFKDMVIVNGQSGDFISGNHIPKMPTDKIISSALVGAIAKKHYSHNILLSNQPFFFDFVENRVARVLEGMPSVMNMQGFAKQIECWGWQARQSIRVVHGQRNYDFFGLGWELPLWEVEYLNFFQKLSLEHKFERRLFRHWLEHRNPFGLFRGYMPYASRWPRGRDGIHLIGRAISGSLGRKVSVKWYRALDCFSQYEYQYAPFGYFGYWKGLQEFSSIIGYLTKAWEVENKDILGSVS